MKREEYGDRKSIYGWEIDHIDPVSNGGSDNIANLQPLQWENNQANGDGTLKYEVISQNDTNIYKAQ